MNDRISTDKLAQIMHAANPASGWVLWSALTMDQRDDLREEAAKLRDELHAHGFSICPSQTSAK